MSVSILSACDGESGTTALFELDGKIDSASLFFDAPYPTDLRLTEAGHPDLTGFPNPLGNALITNLSKTAGSRRAFPVVPVGYFRFSAAVATRAVDDLIAADAASPLLLIDIDETSAERGRLFPVVAQTFVPDVYLPEGVLAVAARPGFVLHPERRYAFVVLDSALDALGNKLSPAPAIASMRSGQTPSGRDGARAKEIYAPLWDTLTTVGVDKNHVVSAAVFTTGDVVADLHTLSDALKAKYTVTVDNLHLDPDDGATHERFCELVGEVRYPQFQHGTPPFAFEGLFDEADGGLPSKQRDEVAPIRITIPKAAMPASGYPLLIYFHGSGGVSSAVVDRGRWDPATQMNEIGKGPAHIVAAFGIAAAGSALPVNPERLPGATETEYLNFNNLAAFRDTFRQGAIEQRLLLEALKTISIDPALLASCAGPSLPVGETAYRFDAAKLVSQGQSMGGMYTNIISAIEPRILAAVPTGAGGYWSYFITKTSLISGLPTLLAALLGLDEPPTFLHPTLHLFETAEEPAEPMVYMPRLGRSPLPGHPARSIYEAVGKDDSYFPTPLYDAIALAYGHPQAGESVWPTMQNALALDGLEGLRSYPLVGNLRSESGAAYSGAVIQYRGDGVYDPHAIYSQLDAVKFQYGCFLSTFLSAGQAKILAPQALGSPCQ